MMTAFSRWARDLDYRAEMFVLARRPEPKQDPLWRYGLTADDYAFLAAIDSAFRDTGASE